MAEELMAMGLEVRAVTPDPADDDDPNVLSQPMEDSMNDYSAPPPESPIHEPHSRSVSMPSPAFHGEEWTNGNSNNNVNGDGDGDGDASGGLHYHEQYMRRRRDELLQQTRAPAAALPPPPPPPPPLALSSASTAAPSPTGRGGGGGGFIQLRVRHFHDELADADACVRRGWEAQRDAVERQRLQLLELEQRHSAEEGPLNQQRHRNKDGAGSLDSTTDAQLSGHSGGGGCGGAPVLRSTLRAEGRRQRQGSRPHNTTTTTTTTTPSGSPAPSPRKNGRQTEAAGNANANGGDGDAFARLYEEAQERGRRLAAERERARRAEEEARRADCSFRPSLSPEALLPSPRRASKGSQRSASQSSTPSSQTQRRGFEAFLASQQEWEERRRSQLAEALRSTAEKEAPGLLRSVAPSTVRRRLDEYLVKKKGYSGPVEGWEQRFHAYMQKKQKGPEPSPTTTTTPSKKAGRPVAPQPALFERLHGEAATRQSARQVLDLVRAEYEAQTFFHPNRRLTELETAADPPAKGEDGAHEQQQQRPSSSPRPRGRRGSPSAAAVFEALHAEQAARQGRRELARMAAEEEDEVFSFQPAVSERSRELLVARAQAIARGERPASRRRAGGRCSAEGTAAGDDHPSPAVRRASPAATAEFLNRVAAQDRKRQERLQAARAAEGRGELAACTFRPRLSIVSRAITTPRGGSGSILSSSATAGEWGAGDAAPLVSLLGGANYCQAMESPEVQRALWGGSAEKAQRPHHHCPQSSGGAAGRAAPSPFHRAASQGQRRGSAASTPRRRSVHDPTPAGPRPLNALLSPKAPLAQGQGRPRALSIDRGGADGSTTAAADARSNAAPPYFRPPAAFFPDEAPSDDSRPPPPLKGSGSPDGRPPRPGEFDDPLSDDRPPSARRRIIPIAAATTPPAVNRSRSGRNDGGTAGGSPTPPPSVSPIAALSSPPSSPPRQERLFVEKERVVADARAAATAATDGDDDDAEAPLLRSNTSPVRVRVNGTTDTAADAVEPKSRPPRTPRTPRTADYGLAGVTGSGQAAPSELQSLEHELRSVLGDWALRLEEL